MPDIYDLDDNLLQIIFDEQDNNHHSKLYNKLLISKNICHPDLFTNLNIEIPQYDISYNFILKYNNLYKLDLSYQNIKDISILPINLTNLNLRECHNIKNLSYLSKLNNLQNLNLNSVSITDISILSINLTNLNLSGCTYIDNLSYLYKLCNLQNLTLYNTTIMNLQFLPISLITLNLSMCSFITHFSELSKLTNLQILDLSNNHISKLYLPPNLIRLSLERCIFGTNDISLCIYELKKLESLNLTRTNRRIYNLPENLKKLYIHNPQQIKCELPKKCKLNPN